MVEYSQPVDGKFGKYGGRYVPETLMSSLLELEREYVRLKDDPAFKEQLEYLFREFAGTAYAVILCSKLNSKGKGGEDLHQKGGLGAWGSSQD